ncbi:MAG: methionine synthase [Rhizobiales bacterium]|nr:methionine synthase [Hyphomicrobiales bacterium]OJU38406.1 MAG: 5-methyltetrahydropteroyltriglutamate--homocysteine methyltransferase [Rhizobiales bacterium 68-8]
MLFPPTIAGSLPKPGWLAETEKLWPKWKLEGAALDQAKRDAALIWVKLQEDAGIETVTDGEQFRTHFVHGFLETVEGIDWNLKTKMGIRNNRYVVDVPTVTAKPKRSRPVHRDEAAFCRAHTQKRLKWTLPGPMTICDTLADGHYGRRADMAMAFAEILNEEALELEAAGCDVIQFDEPAFNVFMEDVKDWGIAALDRAARGLKCATAVHICYGYGIEANIQWKQTLGSEWRQYEEIFPAINASAIGQVSLECANSRVPVSLIGLLPDKQLLVGAIDVATDRIETPEQVASVIAEALKHADAERIQPCTNCGLAPLSRAVAEGKLAALGAGAALARKRHG